MREYVVKQNLASLQRPFTGQSDEDPAFVIVARERLSPAERVARRVRNKARRLRANKRRRKGHGR